MARRNGTKTTGYFGMAPPLAQTRRATRAKRCDVCARNAGILRGMGAVRHDQLARGVRRAVAASLPPERAVAGHAVARAGRLGLTRRRRM